MFKSILKFFSSKEKEIEILTSLSTFAGGSKSENDTHWTCGQKILAYVDCDTNQVHKIEGSITWKTIDNTKHPFNFKPKTVYRVKVKPAKQNNFVIFPLIEVIDSSVRNEQLEVLVDDFFITDGIFSFEFDEKYTSAEGEVNWLGEEIFVYFYDTPDINVAKQTLSHFKKIMKNVYSWDDTLKTYIAEQTLDKINNWLLNYSDHSKITKHILKNDQIIDTINIYPNGDFFITYLLKTYNYMINVEGNVNGELKKAYLEE